MADWNSIISNRRRSGNFMGTTRRDHDAYFEFFSCAGERRFRATFSKSVLAAHHALAVGIGLPRQAAKTIAALWDNVSKDLAIR